MRIVYAFLLLLTLPTLLIAMTKDKNPRGLLLEDITWLEAEKVLNDKTVVVIPLGAAAKEHGPHLKLKNDFVMVEYLKRRVLAEADVVIAPTVNYHFFPAFLEYPGSTSLRLETARDLVIDICRSLARYGPRRFYVLNTGVSTRRALRQAAEILGSEGIVLRYTDIIKITEPAEKLVKQQEGGTHADEIETSMMLYLDPSSVDMSKAVKDYHPDKGNLTRTDNGQGTYSASGIWGDATLATREKGEKVVETLVSGILDEIEALRATTQTEVKAQLATLVEAERSFARTAAVKGIRDSFLEFFSEDSIVFRNGVVSGKKWYTEQQKRPTLLSWQPAFADISLAGDLGYTTGPWELRKSPTDEAPVAYGNYISIWKKQANGEWKVFIDTGVSNPPPGAPPAGVISPIIDPKLSIAKKTDLDLERITLLKADRELSTSLSTNGNNGLLSYLADDARFYRDNHAPALGKEQIKTALATIKEGFTSQLVAGEIARSADLGFTYGPYQLKSPDQPDKLVEEGYYLRIWKRQSDGSWRIALDVLTPNQK